MKQMEINKEKVIEFLRKKKKFLLVGHVHPDGDDIASLCALRDALLLMGRQADMLLEDPVPDRYAFLPAASEIRRTIPENGGYDLIVFTDLSNLERAGSFDFPKTETLCIDHHISNTGYTDYLFLCPQYAATAEILTELFLDGGIQITADMANALYMGIATDSGFFKYSNTSPHTLLMASRLVECGARPDVISGHLDAVSRQGLEVSRLVLETLHFEGGGKIGIACMNEKAMELDGENSDSYVEIPRRAEGVEIALLLKYAGPDMTRVSLRSAFYVNVSELAALFGGGGHIRAAGCTIRHSLAETEKLLVAAALKVL